ncbi:hypothetical protein [Aureimonas pseudogalii]|uniref:Uncharacterized protein n=1 Tax=Aureimonas pseudogalii TaxID=1744844 RepID=A0A7W6H4W8_9HYPH|nr:hypothetical protein [Aureimonas pseudogalii]MBB3998618.1 hypothetical protein [Aureimonas pseudogalii]
MSHDLTTLPRVIKIIDPWKFVINIGLEDGVKNGDRFLIFGPGENLVDPLTRRDLGMLELVRGKARVAHVQDRISTLMSDEYEITPGTKRVVRRKGSSMFAVSNQPTVEEIEEGEERTKTALDVSFGDYARPI